MKKQKFKLLAMIMAITLSLSGFSSIGTNNSDVYADEVTNDIPDAIEINPGDANFDDAINAEDALAALKHAAKLEELGEYNFIRADVDASGVVDAEDALYILEYAANIISSFDELRPDNPTDEPTPKPTKEPTGYEIYDSINVEYDYSNSFVVELTSTENKTYTVEDFPEIALTDVWTRGKMKTDEGYLYELVMVLDAETCTDEILTDAMEKIKAMEGVSEVTYNEYAEHDTILELNHSEYILEVGESIDLSIADFRPYDASTNDSCLIIDFNQDTIDKEALSLEVLSKYGVEKLTEGAYIMTGSNCTWPENARSDYYIEVCEGWGNEISHLTVAHLLSQLPEVDMVQIVRTTFPTGNRDYENWACSDEKVASMVLSGGEETFAATTKLNQTATITALTPGEVTVSVTKGGWGNVEGTGTCTIKVVEPNSVVYEAEYPQMVQYVDYASGSELYYDWLNSRGNQTSGYTKYSESLNDFNEKTIKEALSGSDGKNVVYSPLNVYMGLSLIAETSDGNSRKQILDLIGVDNIETLRDQAKVVWNANYCHDGAVTSVLANSMWLRNDTTYKNELLKTLSENYYASVFRGEMGSDTYNNALHDWLNTQTGNMLTEQVEEIETAPEDVLMLASTVYYRGKWESQFSERNTEEDVFYTNDGEVKASFMKKYEDKNNYYWADKFSAVAEDIEEGGKMWFILPDEGVSVDELLNEAQLMEFIESGDKWENKKEVLVNLSVPKFDVSSKLLIKDMLKNLGVTDIFSGSTASFNPLMEDSEGVFISEIHHGGRVVIDEEGCVATSFVVTRFPGSPLPPEEVVDFNLNRPFIYVLTSEVGSLLYVGIVNNP